MCFNPYSENARHRGAVVWRWSVYPKRLDVDPDDVRLTFLESLCTQRDRNALVGGFADSQQFRHWGSLPALKFATQYFRNFFQEPLLISGDTQSSPILPLKCMPDEGVLLNEPITTEEVLGAIRLMLRGKAPAMMESPWNSMLASQGILSLDWSPYWIKPCYTERYPSVNIVA